MEPARTSGSSRNLSQKVAFNTALLVAGRLVVAASGLIGTIVATRYLGVDDFGQLLTAITYVALFSVLTDAGVWTIAAREIARHPEDEQEILSTVSLIGLLLSALTIVVVLGTTWLIYGGDGRDLVRLGIAISLTQLAVSGPFGTSNALLTAHQRAMPAALGALLAGVGFLIALGIVIALDLGFAGIAATYALSATLNTLVPIAAVVRGASLRPRWNRPLATKILRAAIPQAFVVAITTIYIRIDTVLLSLLATDRDVGYYGVSYRVLEFVLQVPGFIVLTVFPELARTPAGSERLRMLVQGLFSIVVLLAVPTVCVLVGFAPEIVRIVGGAQYDGATNVLRLLALAAALSFPAVVFFNALIATDQQLRLAQIMVVVLIGNIAMNVVLVRWLDASGAALALVISELVSLALAWRLFSRTSTAPAVQLPVRLLLSGLACAGVIAITRHFVSEPAASPILTLVLGSAGATAVYLAALAALSAVPAEVTSAVGQLRRR